MALSNRLTVNCTLNYSNTRFKSPPIASSYGVTAGANSLYYVVFFTPRQLSIRELPYENPITKSPK